MPGGDVTITPPAEWAQRKTCIYVNIRVDDLKDPVIKIEKNRLYFKGTGGVDNKVHELDLELFGEVKPEESKYMVRGRGAEVVLMKADADGPYWKRFLKEDKKQHWLKVDFEKWQDEDESDDEPGGAGGFGGANFEDMMRQMGGLGGAGMGGMGGMGGLGGLGGDGGADLGDDFGEDDDSDDEKLPELEEADEKK